MGKYGCFESKSKFLLLWEKSCGLCPMKTGYVFFFLSWIPANSTVYPHNNISFSSSSLSEYYDQNSFDRKILKRWRNQVQIHTQALQNKRQLQMVLCKLFLHLNITAERVFLLSLFKY